jgi:hypothetical protein
MAESFDIDYMSIPLEYTQLVKVTQVGAQQVAEPKTSLLKKMPLQDLLIKTEKFLPD